MVVEVRLFATFRENRFKKQEMDFPEGASLDNLLDQLKIPKEQIGILLINGRTATLDQKLTANDIVSIFPAIGGG